jgi:hypothetical protein
MLLEDYFAEGLHIGTTHGVCPECLQKLEEDTKLMYRSQAQAQAKPEATSGAATETETPPVVA